MLPLLVEYRYCSENSVWLDLQYLYFRLQVIHKSYRQVLAPVNSSQLLLKLEIRDKLRLVTFHKSTTLRKHNDELVQTRSGETEVLMTLNHRASMLQCSPLKRTDIFSLTQHKLWHFATAVRYNVVFTI